MSTPTFNSVTLVSQGAQETIGSPQDRSALVSLPGVIGDCIQPHPMGSRMLTVTGILTSTAATASASSDNLKTAIRNIQDSYVGVVGTYAGTDGGTNTNAELVAYQAQPSKTGKDGSNYTTFCHVFAVIRELAL